MEPSPVPKTNPSRPTWLVIFIAALILTGFLLTAFYGTRVMHSYLQLKRTPLRPGETDVNLVRGWMTVPYIARAYRVPEDVLWRGLGIPREGNRFKSLRTLDRSYADGQPGIILITVKELINQYQGRPPTPASTITPQPTVP